MAKNVFTVNATQSDANGNFSVASGFPKRFFSDSYSTAADPIKTARRRANASAYSKAADYYSVDNIPLWTITIENAKGEKLLRMTEGDFPEPEPEPEPEPTPEPEPEEPETPEEPEEPENNEEPNEG